MLAVRTKMSLAGSGNESTQLVSSNGHPDTSGQTMKNMETQTLPSNFHCRWSFHLTSITESHDGTVKSSTSVWVEEIKKMSWISWWNQVLAEHDRYFCNVHSSDWGRSDLFQSKELGREWGMGPIFCTLEADPKEIRWALITKELLCQPRKRERLQLCSHCIGITWGGLGSWGHCPWRWSIFSNRDHVHTGTSLALISPVWISPVNPVEELDLAVILTNLSLSLRKAITSLWISIGAWF